jgi:hypothetical protein
MWRNSCKRILHEVSARHVENQQPVSTILRETPNRRENERAKKMKYILMMNTMRVGEGVPNWPQKDLQAHVTFMMNLCKDLGESGELVGAEGLSFPDQAKLVRAGDDGLPVTDGVFPEGKEFLAGYWIVDVESPERAYAIAARASAAPGPGGRPLNMPIEVRPLMCAAPPEML